MQRANRTSRTDACATKPANFISTHFFMFFSHVLFISISTSNNFRMTFRFFDDHEAGCWVVVTAHDSPSLALRSITRRTRHRMRLAKSKLSVIDSYPTRIHVCHISQIGLRASNGKSYTGCTLQIHKKMESFTCSSASFHCLSACALRTQSKSFLLFCAILPPTASEMKIKFLFAI